MADYTELIRALRHCKIHLPCKECPRYGSTGNLCISDLHDDAAAAIEALQAELEKKRTADCWGCKCEKLEPKRGEWIDSKERMRPDMCSVCGCVYEADRFMDKIAWNYCPNCGAKMIGEQNVE